jgi:hypothetical protein
MTRHDPLSALAPSEPPAPQKPARKAATRKAEPLLDVPDRMLVYLAAGRPVAEVRAEFAAFCAERKFTNFRQAWAAYEANLKLYRQALATVPCTFVRTVEKPVPVVEAPLPPLQASARVVPIWLQRHRQTWQS